MNVGLIYGWFSFVDYVVYEFMKGGIDVLICSVVVMYGGLGICVNMVVLGGVCMFYFEF